MRGFTLERNRITVLNVGRVSVIHLIYGDIKHTITISRLASGPALSIVTPHLFHINKVSLRQVMSRWPSLKCLSGIQVQLLSLCMGKHQFIKLFTKLYSCSLFCIPNHQSAFCWIFLPLLTLLIIRSSCPPSHHWTSLGFHFTGLNPISLVGNSGWPGEGSYPKHINWPLGFPRDRGSWTPPLLHIHYITGSQHTVTWLLLPLLR